MDFYEHLSNMENEAMRRARGIRKAEEQAAKRFRHEENAAPSKLLESAQAPASPPAGGLGSLLKGNLLGGDLFANADMSTIMMLFLILKSEQSDPMLMLALLYILM